MKVKVKTTKRTYYGFYLDCENNPVKFAETFDGSTAAFVKHIADTRHIAKRKIFVETYASAIDVYDINPAVIIKYGTKITDGETDVDNETAGETDSEQPADDTAKK